MAEKAPKKPESAEAPKLDAEQVRKNYEHIRKTLEDKAEKAAEHHRHHNDAEKIKDKIEDKAEKAEDLEDRINSQAEDSQPSAGRYSYDTGTNMKQALVSARKQLRPSAQKFSKFVHNPAVEKVSDVGGATVARPSGMFYGSLFAFIATLIFFVISKAYGYEYNPFVAIGAFVGGFSLGLIVEFVTSRFKRTA